MPDEPIAHIARPNPPWRDDRLTECGKPEADVARTITCADAIAMIKEYGKQRASLFLCQTCTSTASRHSHGRYGEMPQPQDWSLDPAAVLARHLERARPHSQTDMAEQIRAELQAVGMVIDAHRDEFDQALAGILAAPKLTDLRKRRARRATR